MALRTALSRRRRKIPAINNPTTRLLRPRIWVTLKNYPNIGLLHLTQGLGNTKTTQTLKKITPKMTQKAQPSIWVKKKNPGFLECASAVTVVLNMKSDAQSVHLFSS